MNFFSKLKLTLMFTVLISVFGLFSCSKSGEEKSENVNDAEMEAVSAEDPAESNEDLLAVDYTEFYDELAPHGEWIEVKGSDIGVDLDKPSGELGGDNHRSISFSELFGVKDARADEPAVGAFFVWKPSPGLTVGVAAGEQQPVYEPYTNGQWVYTSQGWYFKAASEPEEITHHYGRWAHSPSIGWVWVPGRVWSPAWVDWRENDDYVAWQPVPPGIYLAGGELYEPPVVEERYVIVEKRHFVQPVIYRYTYRPYEYGYVVKEWRRPRGVVMVEKRMVNYGPEYTVIQNVTGINFGIVNISMVTSRTEVRYTGSEYVVYTPLFKRVKEKHKFKYVISHPRGYEKYENAVVKHEKERKELKSAGKNQSGINPKYIDDSNMKDGGKNRRNDDRKHFDDNNRNKNGKNDDKGKNRNDNGFKEKKKDDNGKKDNNNRNNEKRKKNNNDGKNQDGKKNGNDDKVKQKGNDRDKGNKEKGNNDKGGKDKGNKKSR